MAVVGSNPTRSTTSNSNFLKSKQMSKKPKKMKAEKENKKVSLDVYMADGHYYVCWRGPITINEDTHPELKGMTKEQIEEYVKENAETMAAVDSDFYDNLWDQLMDYDYNKDKILDETYELEFSETEEGPESSSYDEMPDEEEDDFDDEDDD